MPRTKQPRTSTTGTETRTASSRTNKNGTKSTKLRVISGTGTSKPNENAENGTELTNEQVTDIIKQKRKRNRPDLANFGQENVEPGDNARYLRYAMVAFDLPPIDIADPEQVKNRIELYLTHCIDNDRKPSIAGVANWLGISRDTLNSWKNGEYRNDSHSDLIKKVYTMMEEIMVDYFQNGKVNPASGIFLLKNMFGYKDTADVVITPNNPMQDLDAETARKRLLDAIPDEDDN